MLDILKSSGVVGAGGAGFPTYAKLTQDAEYILLNAAECEPLIRVDQQLLAIYPSEVLTGLDTARKFINAKKAIIGIKAKHAQVIEIINKTIDALGLVDVMEVKPMADIYPAGDEQVMVYELTGRVVPETSIPIAVGCVVTNVETMLNLYNAVNNGMPVTETYITLTGDIANPITFKAPVGTPVAEILKLGGIEDFAEYSIIDGGPMMGPLLEDVLDDVAGYATKKSKAFIVLKNDSHLIRKKKVTFEQARRVNRGTCEQCRMCTDLCPRYLLGHNSTPHKTMRLLSYNLNDEEGKKATQLCCLCGLCEYFSCPVGLYPKTANAHFKDMIWRENLRYQPVSTEFEARNNREYRMLPSKRLIQRLGLSPYDVDAPMSDIQISPSRVRILVRQHVGAPASPVVGLQERVHKGQLIGDIADDALGAAIHASIDGVVTEITKDYIEITAV